MCHQIEYFFDCKHFHHDEWERCRRFRVNQENPYIAPCTRWTLMEVYYVENCPDCEAEETRRAFEETMREEVRADVADYEAHETRRAFEETMREEVGVEVEMHEDGEDGEDGEIAAATAGVEAMKVEDGAVEGSGAGNADVTVGEVADGATREWGQGKGLGAGKEHTIPIDPRLTG